MAEDRTRDESTGIEAAIAEDLGAGAPEATPQGANRRAHVRTRGEHLTNLGARLTSGAEIRLIDLSRGGAQFECDRRFLPNATLSLRLVTPDTTFVVSGRVVRSRIVRIDSKGLGYNVAVAFDELLQNLLEQPAAEATASTTTRPTSRTRVIDGTPAGKIPAGVDAHSGTHSGEALPAGNLATDISAEEAAAFEAAAPTAPAGFTVTASVEHTGEQLRDLFNGADW